MFFFLIFTFYFQARCTYQIHFKNNKLDQCPATHTAAYCACPHSLHRPLLLVHVHFIKAMDECTEMAPQGTKMEHRIYCNKTQMPTCADPRPRRIQFCAPVQMHFEFKRSFPLQFHLVTYTTWQKCPVAISHTDIPLFERDS